MHSKKIKFQKLKDVNRPHSIHGIYPYRGKMSSLDAQQVIRQLPKKGVLLDPFCGSGTIIYEARRHGLTTIGVDSNPIAVQISKAKLSKINIIKSVKKIKGIIDSLDLQSELVLPEKARNYFHERTANQLIHLMQFYDDFSDYEKAAFLGTICLAARGCNGYKWSSTQIGKIKEEKTNIDFFKKFLMKLKKHAYPVDFNNSTIIEGDTRNLSSYLQEKSVDFVYTSPPYFDALDYTSYYTRIIHNIFENKVEKIKEKLIQSYASYAEDIKRCFEEIKKVTKDDTLIIFVVGDKKKKNKVINGGEFFSEIIQDRPSYMVQREYTGTASNIWDKINKTKRKEQIIVWDKAKWSKNTQK